jgi:hypothetical protein
MPLQKRRFPFDDPDYIFELKYDGFRALAVIENGHAQLISRNGHPFASFADLAENICRTRTARTTPMDKRKPTLRTEQETSQPNRVAVEYWASGLEPIYLEGAFARAQVRLL